VRRAALALLLGLCRCSCELPGAPDAALFGCTSNVDCIPGYLCLAGRCLPEGTPPPDSGAGGGSEALSAQLRFTSSPRTAATGECSQEVTFGLFDDAGQPVFAERDVVVSATSLDLSLFSDFMCQSGQGAFPVRSTGTLYFKGTRPGMFDIRLSGDGLSPATQTETVVSPVMPRLVFTSPPPAAALAGTCVQGLTVELRDGAGAPLPAPDGGLAVDLVSQPAGLSFSPGPGCSPGTVTIAAGASSATFAATSATGLDYTVTASAPGVASDMLAVPLRPLVRSGTCDLASNEHVRVCALAPGVLDTSRSFLVYQVSPTDHDPSRASVACLLADAGAVSCQRVADGGTASITWQVAELQGARVDRYDVRCPTDGGRAVTVPLAVAVQPDRHFLLNAMSSNGVELTGNDFFTMSPGPNQLDVQWGANGCGARRTQVQVVQVPGFSTVRSSGSLVGVYTSDSPGLPAPDGGTFVIASWRAATPGGGENRVCDRMVRAYSTSATAVRASRAAGNTVVQCTEFDVEELDLERVDVGRRGSVQELTVFVDAGVARATRTIAAVDLTRALVFTSGQSGGGGQAAGEGAYEVDGGGFLGEATATLRLTSPTQLQLERAGTRAAAVFTVYVVQLEP